METFPVQCYQSLFHNVECVPIHSDMGSLDPQLYLQPWATKNVALFYTFGTFFLYVGSE